MQIYIQCQKIYNLFIRALQQVNIWAFLACFAVGANEFYFDLSMFFSEITGGYETKIDISVTCIIHNIIFMASYTFWLTEI